MGSAFSRMAIFIFSFIGIFAVLFSAIDGRFFLMSYSSSAGYDADIAQQFSLANVTLYANSGEDNMTYPYSSYHDNGKTWGGGLTTDHYLEVWWGEVEIFPPYYVPILQFRHIEDVWWGELIHGTLNFEGVDSHSHYGDTLTKASLVSEYDELTNGSAFYAECTHMTVSTIFDYNQSKYANISEAWDGGEMSYILSYQVDWNATQVSALTILGQLLTFSSPSLGITGIGGTILNAMIAIPFLIMTIILIIKLIQSVIPFIGGVDD